MPRRPQLRTDRHSGLSAQLPLCGSVNRSVRASSSRAAGFVVGGGLASTDFLYHWLSAQRRERGLPAGTTRLATSGGTCEPPASGPHGCRAIQAVPAVRPPVQRHDSIALARRESHRQAAGYQRWNGGVGPTAICISAWAMGQRQRPRHRAGSTALLGKMLRERGRPTATRNATSLDHFVDSPIAALHGIWAFGFRMLPGSSASTTRRTAHRRTGCRRRGTKRLGRNDYEPPGTAAVIRMAKPGRCTRSHPDAGARVYRSSIPSGIRPALAARSPAASLRVAARRCFRAECFSNIVGRVWSIACFDQSEDGRSPVRSSTAALGGHVRAHQLVRVDADSEAP